MKIMTEDKFHFIDSEFERRKQEQQLRHLRPVVPQQGAFIDMEGTRLLNFCSNDYLGLSRHPLLTERAAAFMARYGAGATASRLICGSYDCMHRAEEKLAAAKQTESALLFSSGYQANATLLPALCDKNSLILSDRLNHNSIIAGCRLARCTVRLFAHNDTGDLEKQLLATADETFSRVIIVTETVFSMDGDICRLDDLMALAETFGAILVVDEAHATGVFGENGMGVAAGRAVDLVMGTFGKGCGSFGAYVAAAERIRQFLINCCAGFIYTTGLPPAVIGEIDAALDLIPKMGEERRRLAENAHWLRSRLNAAGLDTGHSAAQIVPVIVGEEERALSLSCWLKERGLLAVAIRPPSVPPGQSRIRISLTALHTPRDVENLAEAVIQWKNRQ